MTWVDWILPATVGAIIGYVTNDLAIRMLFRPLTQKKLFGIPIPFTPGVIPRQREKLARSLGRMTSNELLNAESIMVHLRRTSTLDALSASLGNSLESFLSRPAVYYLEKINTSEGAWSRVVSIVKTALVPFLDKLWDSPLERVLPEGARGALTKLLAALSQRINNPKEGLVAGSGFSWLKPVLLERFPYLQEALRGWLHSADVKTALNESGLYLLRRALEALSTVQRFLVSAIQYDKSLESSMPELTESAVNRFLGFLDDPDHQGDLIDRALRVLHQSLTHESLSERMSPWIMDFWEESKSLTLKENLEKYFGWDREKFVTWFGEKLGLFGGVGSGLLEDIKEKAWAQKPLNQLLGLESFDFASLSRDSAEGLISMVEKELPGFLQKFDIQQMVENRVNSLELVRVEGLLLQVIEKHLKWINVFGALLGALLGLSQTLMRLFGVIG